MVVQLEDVLGVREQANLPGTTDEQPNWRRKLPRDLDAMADGRALAALAAIARRGCGRSRAAAAAATPAAARVPRATYRLQLHHDFTFDDATRVAAVPRAARREPRLLLADPARARRQPARLRHRRPRRDQPRDRRPRGLRALRRGAARARHGPDARPGAQPHGRARRRQRVVARRARERPGVALRAVLRHRLAAADRALDGKVLLPVLGDHVRRRARARRARAARSSPSRGGFAVRYHEHRFPVDARDATPRCSTASSAADAARRRRARRSIAAAFARTAGARRLLHDADAPASRAREGRRAEGAARRARRASDAGAARSASTTALDDARREAATRCTSCSRRRRIGSPYWRVAADEINYRRFFDINELAALRMEDDAVFEATQALRARARRGRRRRRPAHRPPRRAVRPGAVLPAAAAGLRAPRRPGRCPKRRSDGRARPLYVVVEKIAAAHEDVPEAWAVHGTTGYRFAIARQRPVRRRGSARREFDRIWRGFAADRRGFDEHRLRAASARSCAARSRRSSTVLATELLRIARADRRTRDYTFNTLRQALAEVVACLPVYRTYIVDAPSAQDRRYIDWAVAQARRRSRGGRRAIFEFVRRALLGEAVPTRADGAAPSARCGCAMRFQQFTAPVAAKGVEDTAFYRYKRLVSLNDVGGDPARSASRCARSTARAPIARARWPHTMLATSTHDNKRSEDVRAASTCCRRCRPSGACCCGAGARMNRGHRTPGRRHAGAVAGRRVPALPDPARHAARRWPRRRRRWRPTASASQPTC